MFLMACFMSRKIFKLACVLAFTFMCKFQLPAQAQGEWNAQLKMPYSGDYILLLKQFTHDGYTDNGADTSDRSYFEFYRLALKKPQKYSQSDCSERISLLSDHIKNSLQQKASEIGSLDIGGVDVHEALCTDLNQNNQPEVFLKVHNSGFFGNRQGIFFYKQNEGQIFNLLGTDSMHLRSDEIFLRWPSATSKWPDILGISYAGLNSRTVYITPQAFSETENTYKEGKLIYADTEKFYHTQNKTLDEPEFNFSQVNAQTLILNRNGSLAGFIYREGLNPSGWVVDFLKVVETQTGRAEQVYLGDKNKGVYQALKQKFPRYMQTSGFAKLEPEILGFNQDKLIFKLHIYGSCYEADYSGPPCDGSLKIKATGPDYNTQIEKLFPERFAGYWSYHYRTGALKLISWDSKAPINVEHTGYDVKFN